MFYILDCDLNIGNPQPEYQFAKTETQIILDISQNVYDMILNQIDDLICMLSALEPNSNVSKIFIHYVL